MNTCSRSYTTSLNGWKLRHTIRSATKKSKISFKRTWYVASEFLKRLWLTMGLNSSHWTSKTSARNGESKSPSPFPAIQRPMGKWSRQTRQSSRSSRNSSRKPRVFGQTSYQVRFRPTKPPFVLPLVKLHSHSHMARRQSYLSSVAFHQWDTCSSMMTQIESCSITTWMQLTSYMTKLIFAPHSTNKR